MVWLAIVQSVIHTVAALFSCSELFVIVALLISMSTAAYRQLFSCQDQIGILSNKTS